MARTIDEDLQEFFDWIDGKISDEKYGARSWADMTESQKEFSRKLQYEFDKEIFSTYC